MNPFTTETDLTELLDWLESQAAFILTEGKLLAKQP